MASTINASTSAGLISTGDTSGVLALQTNSGTTAVTIDTSQNVGIGTSSPAAKLELGSGTLLLSNNVFIQQKDSSGNAKNVAGVNSSNQYNFGGLDGSSTVNTIRALVAGNEAMRIDSSGNLCVNTTAQISGTAGKMNLYYSRTTHDGFAIQCDSTSIGLALVFTNPNGKVGQISTSGSATTYTTSSDYRLKENIEPMTGALATVAQLKPVTYKWKVDGSNGQGFIAHELQEVVPDAVIGEKDALDRDGNPDYQGIDTSFLVATLTAALQETKALIDQQAETINALTARVVALEGR